ncbi:hypothetical protein GCM10027570_45780 [Streptomonospora sediminis]
MSKNENWHKSSYSRAETNCVEVRETAEAVDIRDTQNRAAGKLTFDGKEWTAFLNEIHAGRL